MKIPSKVISYKESSISKYARTLQRLEKQSYSPIALFNDMKDVFIALMILLMFWTDYMLLYEMVLSNFGKFNNYKADSEKE